MEHSVLDGSAHPLVSDFVGLENQPGDMSTEEVRDLGAAAELASNANITLPDTEKGSVALGPPQTQAQQAQPQQLAQPPPPPPPPPAVADGLVQVTQAGDGPLAGLASAATTQPAAAFTIGKKPDTDIPPAPPRVPPKSTVASSTGKTKGDYQKKYRSTEKGKLAQKKAQEKYRKSEKGKSAQNKARKKWRESNPYQRSSGAGATTKATTSADATATVDTSKSAPLSPPPPPPPPPPPLPLGPATAVSAASPADAAAVASLSNLGSSQNASAQSPIAASTAAMAPGLQPPVSAPINPPPAQAPIPSASAALTPADLGAAAVANALSTTNIPTDPMNTST